MSLDDLLVSYKLVKGPKHSVIDTSDLSSNKYLRMLTYINTKNTSEKETETPVTNTDSDSDGFVGWSFDTTSKQPTTTSNISVSGSPWSSPYNTRKNLWVSDMTASYKRAGLNDNAIKNLIAKNALESGWGKSALGDYNFGNITTGSSWSGRYVQGKDHDANGKKISLKFRAYDSMDDYVKDEIQFLTNLYEFNLDDDFDTFINKLQGGNSKRRRYAEDKEYANKVRNVYNNI